MTVPAPEAQLNHDYHLGLPAWAFPGWQSRYLAAKPSVLGSYASVFSTVEGNTTFYQVHTDRVAGMLVR